MSTLKLKGSSSGEAEVTVAAAAGTPTITLPTASINLATAGNNGEFLQTNGSGTLSFAAVDTTPEGTAVKSTTNSNEAATKFLRADGDGTCSWQIPSSGKLLQQVRVATSTSQQNAGANTTWTQVGPTVTITPTLATSKILVCVNAWAIVKNIGEFSHNIYRTIGGVEGDLQHWWGEAADDNWMPMNMHALIVDSPNTTSEISYKTRIYCTSNYADFRWNYDGGADPTASLIAIEVGV